MVSKRKGVFEAHQELRTISSKAWFYKSLPKVNISPGLKSVEREVASHPKGEYLPFDGQILINRPIFWSKFVAMHHSF